MKKIADVDFKDVAPEGDDYNGADKMALSVQFRSLSRPPIRARDDNARQRTDCAPQQIAPI